MSTTIPGILVVGQRREAGSAAPFPGRGGDSPPDQEMPGTERPPVEGGGDPCSVPELRKDWNADAGAAQTTKDMKNFAKATNPNEQDFNDREYGAALWERADGSVVRGPITAGEQTFQEASMAALQGLPSRASVTIDWTPPFPDAVLIGMIHSHPVGGTTPSGGNYSEADQGNLTYVQNYRDYQRPGSGSEGRIYIASNTAGSYNVPGPTKINVYDHRNRDAAIGGQEGPEVNPDAQPC